MPDPIKILAFAGSLRTASFNKKLIKIAAEGVKQAGGEFTLIDLKDYPLPIFDEDIEKQATPDNVKKLKEIFLAHQGLLLSCPEYNSSISAVLKNTIDWVSRPVPGQKPLNCFDGKVAGLMSAAASAFGGAGSLVTVRSILGNIKVLVLPEQLTVPKCHEAFNDDGTLKDPKQTELALTIARRVTEVAARLRA